MAKKQAETRAASELFGDAAETLRALGEQLGKLTNFVRMAEHLYSAIDAGDLDRIRKTAGLTRDAYEEASAAARGS